jgi:hypothetical protein
MQIINCGRGVHVREVKGILAARQAVEELDRFSIEPAECLLLDPVGNHARHDVLGQSRRRGLLEHLAPTLTERVDAEGPDMVDIITNATRRAIRGNLQEKGWGRIPQLMIHRGKKREYISLFSLQEDPEPDRVYPYAAVLDAFRRNGRLLLPEHERKRLLRRAK